MREKKRGKEKKAYQNRKKRDRKKNKDEKSRKKLKRKKKNPKKGNVQPLAARPSFQFLFHAVSRDPSPPARPPATTPPVSFHLHSPSSRHSASAHLPVFCLSVILSAFLCRSVSAPVFFGVCLLISRFLPLCPSISISRFLPVYLLYSTSRFLPMSINFHFSFSLGFVY